MLVFPLTGCSAALVYLRSSDAVVAAASLLLMAFCFCPPPPRYVRLPGMLFRVPAFQSASDAAGEQSLIVYSTLKQNSVSTLICMEEYLTRDNRNLHLLMNVVSAFLQIYHRGDHFVVTDVPQLVDIGTQINKQATTSTLYVPYRDILLGLPVIAQSYS